MPIKFRCAYCNQLMGIARRKAGTVVSCPTCGGQVVVPTPEPPIQPVQLPPTPGNGPPQANVFEKPDFDAGMFNPKPVPAPPPAPVPAPSLPAQATMPSPAPAQFASSGFDVEPVIIPPSAHRHRGMVLTPGKIMLLAIGVFLLVGGAFAAGYLCAKLVSNGP
jgi:DNA-directed RNA polymerase subunit RPC12/RpoP